MKKFLSIGCKVLFLTISFSLFFTLICISEQQFKFHRYTIKSNPFKILSFAFYFHKYSPERSLTEADILQQILGEDTECESEISDHGFGISYHISDKVESQSAEESR